MTSGPISGIPLGQSFSRSCQSTTPTLRDIQEKNLGGVSSGHANPQLHPENSQVMSPNLPGPVQPLHPAPSTPPLALEIKAPTSSSLASPQLSLTRAATLTHTVSPCSTAQSAERMQAIIQQSDDHVPANPVATSFQSDLSLENRELEELPQNRWLETAGLPSRPNAQEEQPLHCTEATQLNQSNPDALWHPLRPATTFQDAFATLRSWQSTFLTALHDLQARPDPLDLLCSILPLFDALAFSDTEFFLKISSLTRFSCVCVDRTLENLFAFIAGLDAELALKATQEKETRSRKEQSQGTRQRGEENTAPKEDSKSKRQGDQEEDSKDTREDLRAPQLQVRTESPKPKCSGTQERRDLEGFKTQLL